MQNQVKETYNRNADHFSKTRDRVWPETGKYLKKLKKGDKILDLGCGNGRLLLGINQEVKYLGVDFSEELIKIARKLHPLQEFRIADITEDKAWVNLDKFDAIFCVGVLHHLHTRKKQLYILKQARKHLKKNGFVYISVWNLWRLNRIKHHFKQGSLRLKLKNWRWINTLFHNKWLMFCFAFDKHYLQKLFKDAGYKKMQVYYSDKRGKQTNMLKGQNLCVTAKLF